MRQEGKNVMGRLRVERQGDAPSPADTSFLIVITSSIFDGGLWSDPVSSVRLRSECQSIIFGITAFLRSRFAANTSHNSTPRNPVRSTRQK